MNFIVERVGTSANSEQRLEKFKIRFHRQLMGDESLFLQEVEELRGKVASFSELVDLELTQEVFRFPKCF